MANLPVVVDGRVDKAKLLELLATGAEQEGLDFKATIDLSHPRDQVEHVKDLLAMMSLSAGGYIIVGVNNNGVPATDQKPINPAHFDSATLHQKVLGYVDGRPSIISQVHELKTDESGGTWHVALIFAGPPPGLLPLVVTKQGAYDQPGGKKQKVVFHAGQIIVRDGTTTATLGAEFWPRLLQRYTEKVKDDARRDVDALVHRIVAMLGNQQDTTGAPDDGTTRGYAATSPPIDVDMDLPTFAIAADALIDSGSLPRVDRFLVQAGGKLRQDAASENYTPARGLLNRVFVLATSAVLYGTTEQLDRIIETLVDYYNAVPEIPDAVTNETPQEQRRAAAWFEVLSHLYLLGSLAVRRRKWAQLRSLVLRPYQVHETYSYASWLRHAITSAARAEVLGTEDNEYEGVRGAPVISRVIQLATEIPELRPDVPGSGSGNVQERLLDSLCEFDILWCILAQSVTTRPHATDFYPSSSELDQEHANRAFVLIATDSSARETLFPGKTDQEIGSALLYVYSRARRQPTNHSGWWHSLPDVAEQWAAQVGAPAPDPSY